jgi:plasmid stabilization system protein ParE
MPKKYRVNTTRKAERDVEAIRDYIARDRPKAADRWVREFEKQVAKLTTFPFAHEIIPEETEEGTEYRHCLFGNYRTIHRVEGQDVFILRVIHAARLLNPETLERNLPPSD